MAGDEIAAIRRVTERLHDLAETFPGFRYVELSGPAVSDEQLTLAALSSIAGDAEYIYRHDVEGATASCVYGAELEDAVGLLNLVADEIWLAVRRVLWHFQDRGGDAVDGDFPAIRESGVPFVLIGTTLAMAMEFPQHVAEEFAKLGVDFQQRLRGGTEVHQGPVTVKDGCLLFPGSLYVPCPPAADEVDDIPARYGDLLAAAGRGELNALHSLSPAFKLISAFFDSVLTLEQLGREIESARESREDEPRNHRERPDLIAPMAQAEMLGWAEPQSNGTLKRLAALRDAVQSRGIALEARRVKGMGNKTLVPREQWAEVVKLYELFADGSTGPDGAIASMSGGVRLTNSTGCPVSYRCDGCGEVTRTDAAEPECSGCHKHDRLRPLTSPRRK